MIPGLIVALPLVGALLGLLGRRHIRLARAIATGGTGLALLCAVIGFVQSRGDGSHVITTFPALRAGELKIPLRLATSPSTAAIALVVVLVATLIQMYSVWYLHDDDRYAEFAASVSLFSGAMLLVVHSGDLVYTLIGWEVMGWCSYLLIGHWSRKETARRAAHKAFLVTRFADIGFVIGVLGLSAGAGSTATRSVITAWQAVGDCPAGGVCTAPDGTLRAVLLSLLIIGILGKSAQVPFQDWLPDAMEGPTPASALIHAATMVAAGTVVLGQLFDLVAVSDPARWLLGIATSVTMVLAGVLAFGQSDLKRLLAWSTVSQVGIMLSALAAAPLELGPDAGLFHMWAHAIFKALLFLSIGWLSVVAGGTSAKLLRGSALQVPLVHLAFLAGLVSLAGVPLVVVGGYSKEQVVSAAYNGATSSAGPGLLVLVALLIAVVLTAAYSARAYIVVTARDPQPEGHRPHASATVASAAADAHEAAPPTLSLRVVIATLLLLTVLGALVERLGVFTLEPFDLAWTAVTFVLIVIGVGIAYRGRGAEGDPAVTLYGRRMALADGGLGADGLYLKVVARPVLALAGVVASLDEKVVDGTVRGLAQLTTRSSRGAETFHRGERPATGIMLVAGGFVLLAALGVLAWS
jgi:NADH-quinone oxidoreductase subunit L